MDEEAGQGSKPPRSKGFSAAGFVGMFVLSVLLGISGPFGTYLHGDFGERLAYWTVLVIVSWFLSEVLMGATARAFGARLLLREAVTIVVFTAIFTPFLIGWTMLALPGHAVNLLGWAKLGVYVFVICIGISLIRHGIPFWIRTLYDTETQHPEPARLLRRLPADFTGEVIRVSADGHRVEVITTADRFELRMRLADAVDEMWPIRGLCVHRSHWVAENAVQSVTMERGRPVLILTNGDRIPVGAKYHPEVEAAGWLSARGMGTVQA